MSVTVDYTPIIPLPDNHVVLGGSAFNCGACSDAVCCNTVSGHGQDQTGCLKCRCQGKYSKCSPAGTFCLGRKCDDGLRANNIMYSGRIQTTMPCSAALLIANTYDSSHVFNANAIATQCDPAKKMLCCKGDASVNSTDCGPYWGPASTTGECDTIMQTFCGTTSGTNDPSCNCINSDLPLPECVDRRCANTSAFKTVAMKTNQCLGNYQFCQQYFNLDADAQNNVLQDVDIVQNCNQYLSSNGSLEPDPDPTKSKKLLLWVLIGAGVGVVLLVVLIASVVKISKKVNQPKTIIIQRPRPTGPNQPIRRPNSPNQPIRRPNQPLMRPNSPNQPIRRPNQPLMRPNQPNMMPRRPNSPMMRPNQPIRRPNSPNMRRMNGPPLPPRPPISAPKTIQ